MLASHPALGALLTLAIVAIASTASAQIYRWDNGQVIPGTEDITPGPGVNLAQWNREAHNLRYADLDGTLDLSNSDFSGSWLNGALLLQANLTGANLAGANLTRADFYEASLVNTILTGAVVTGTAFNYTTSRGFTYAQLASTASYRAKTLQGIRLPFNDLGGWDFSGQDLSGAVLDASVLTSTKLAGAIVTDASFGDCTWYGGFTQAQLASTASFQAKDLRGIVLGGNDLTGWDFSGQSLAGASFGSAKLGSADFAGAVVADAKFMETVSAGFTWAQLASTASYRAKDLHGINLGGNDLSGWDFSGQNLTGANLGASTLANANLFGANLTNADLRGANLANLSHQDATLYGTDLRSTKGFDFEPHPGLRNAILPVDDAFRNLGEIRGLDVRADETLVLTNNFHAPAIAGGDWFTRVSESFSVAARGTLEVHLTTDEIPKGGGVYDTTPLEFAPDVSCQPAGVLRLVVGRNYQGMTVDVFDWPAPLAPGNVFDRIEVPAGTLWDTTHLYATGEVTLLAIHAEGDVDGDGQIDLADYSLLRENFGRSGVNLLEGDLTGNSRVDLADFGLLKANFGKTAPAAAAPEPGGLLLAVFGLTSLVLTRPR